MRSALLILSILAISAFAQQRPQFDPQQCVSSIQDFAQSVKQLIDDAKAGKDISTLIAEAMELAQKAKTLIQVCDPRKLSKQLKDEDGDIPACIASIAKVAATAKLLIKHVQEKDIASIVADITLLATQIPAVLENCGDLDIFDDDDFVLTQTSDKDKLQSFLNGIFKANQLPNPTTVVPCFDDASATLTIQVIGQLLDLADGMSLSDIKKIQELINDFKNKINPNVLICLSTSSSQEFMALLDVYGISATTDFNALMAKVKKYALSNFSKIMKTTKSLNAKWKAGAFDSCGEELALLLKDMLKATLLGNGDKDTIQTIFNGVYTQNKLPNPTTIVVCIDDKSAGQITVFIGQLLAKLATAKIGDLNAIIKMIKDFGNQLDPAVGKCLQGNKELIKLANAYGIQEGDDPKKWIAKAVSYITFHYAKCHTFSVNQDANWKAAKYYDFGFQTAEFGHEVLKMKSTFLN